ncbi:MAG: DNA repair protein RecN [Nitrospirales bacterium]|nr:DNA repair protein RecN [Nitrospirales bacterium]
MLAELRISNFALIDSLLLEFPSGFLVFTGETGTGKSLLIDAILLLIGGRASSEHIRFGAEEAVLEARLLIPDRHPVLKYLFERGLLLDDQRDCIVRRVLSRSGKNRIYLNGQMAPLQVLQEVGPQLVDIHGQHEQQALLSPKAQLGLLDSFGGLEDLLVRYQGLYREWEQAVNILETFQKQLQDSGRRQDLLRYQYDELRKLDLQVGEEEVLNDEYHRLKHSGRLGELSHQAFRALYEEDLSVLERLSAVKQAIGALGEIDAQGQGWVSLVESAEAALREVTDALRDYRGNLEYDPDRMEEIDHRLALIQRAKKKYGKTVEELLGWTQTLEEDLAKLEHSEDEMARLRSTAEKAEQAMRTCALDLSSRRKSTAKQLVQRVRQELAALKLDAMTFQVNLHAENGGEEYGPSGMDRIEILLAPNPGEPCLPLERIASGGELSRIMLALKTVLAGKDQTPVVIFDEIDSGVGGEAGMVMGTRLRQLGQYHQVCCITHLPQIAAQAHSQCVVEKHTIDNRTLTQVRQVHGKERELEIARMLGGGTLTPTIRKTATELLQRGQTGVGDSGLVAAASKSKK